MFTTAFVVVAILAIAAQGLLLFLALFEPSLRYKITRTPSFPLGSREFAQLVEALTDSKINRATRVEVLANGEVFYQAMLDAIGQAQHSVNIEAYIFQRGKVTRALSPRWPSGPARESR